MGLLYSTENDMQKRFENLLTKIEGLGIKTEQLRCNILGENNKYLTEIFNQRGISLKMTAAYTPQMKGVVETAFITTRDQAFASMLAAQFSTKSHNKLWAEAIHTATKIGNILPTQTRLIYF